MQCLEKKEKYWYFAKIIFILSLVCVGLFYEFLSCIVSVAMLGFIAHRVQDNGLKLTIGISSVAMAVLVISYLIVSIWAVDSGMAILGFFKFLPALLFPVVLMQDQDLTMHQNDILGVLPPVMVAMTIVSAIFMQFDFSSDYFSVAGRLTGFFQYANTFALMLLVALIVLVIRFDDYKMPVGILGVIILLFGIVYSGSRTVFVMTVVSVIALIFASKNKKIKVILFGTTAIVVVAALIYVAVTGNTYAIGRFLTISLKESTFVGRLLYWHDALPIILKHPFGTGYLGFYYLQTSIQTGVYSIRSVHNDLLQFVLDVGFVPTIGLLVALVRSIFRKGVSFERRLILLVVCAHALFDFDLQFVGLMMLLVLLIDFDGKEVIIYKKKGMIALGNIALLIVCAYFALALALSNFGAYKAALKLYPYNTQDKIEILTTLEDPFEMDNLADKILEQNKSVLIAYDAKALYWYSKGDLDNYIEYKDKAIATSPLDTMEKLDYCKHLITFIDTYKNQEDIVVKCKEKLEIVANDIKNVDSRLSKWGTMIKDQPDSTVPDIVWEYIK